MGRKKEPDFLFFVSGPGNSLETREPPHRPWYVLASNNGTSSKL